MKGYIYILKRFGERFLKIGKTTKDPEIRAAELSAETGVSTPFIVIHAEEVSDIHSCESEIHNALDEFRVSPRREFFDISVKEALNIMEIFFEKIQRRAIGMPHLSSYEFRTYETKHKFKFKTEDD